MNANPEAKKKEVLQEFVFKRHHKHAGREYKPGEKGQFNERVIEKLKDRKADQPLPDPGTKE